MRLQHKFRALYQLLMNYHTFDYYTCDTFKYIDHITEGMPDKDIRSLAQLYTRHLNYEVKRLWLV